MYSLQYNPTKAAQTGTPCKYPQKYFKVKPCRGCTKGFTPKAPSELYCSDSCKDQGIQDAYLTRKYGINLDRYHQMLAEQDGKCKICEGEGFVMNPKIHKVKLVVDHCHLTMKVRGLLCHNCNRALGLLRDDTATISRALTYLQENK